jgi:hypothetical protein
MQLNGGWSGGFTQTALSSHFNRLLHNKYRGPIKRRVLYKPRRAAVSQQGEPDAWRAKQKTLWEMLAFMGPALVIPLGEPLMSVVDTICIGQVGHSSISKWCWSSNLLIPIM